MNNTQGSRVFALGSSTYVRGNAAALAWVAALFLALFVLAMPHDAHADVIFQSAASSTDQVQVYTPDALHHWFGSTLDNPVVDLGTWDQDDFTLGASTTIHMWLRWNGVYESEFDVIVQASVGGSDPFYGTGSTTAQVSFLNSGGYSRIENVSDDPGLHEYVIPTLWGATIHRGDELWAFLYPSWSAYGANEWMGASGTTPFIQICDHDCTSSSATPPPVPPTPSCSQDCFSNVLFIPGAEASRLYGTDGNDNEERFWEPNTSADAEQLAFNPDGTSKRDDIYTRDIIDSAYVPGEGDIYSSFIAEMNTLKGNGTINDWAAAPYDWRYSLEDIISHGTQSGSNISYAGATDTPYIVQQLKQLAATSKTGKVTIIAHSEGGLVAKALMQQLGDEETSQLIDKVIFVAVPQVGTPSAIAGLLHGYGQGISILGSNKVTDAVAREVGDTLPGMYYLLPSADYFTYVDDPVVTFSGAPDWAARYGDPIHSVDRLDPFLTDATRPQPASTDLVDPTMLKANYVAQAEIAHQAIDAWTPPSGLQVIQIAGWGMPTTLSGINYADASSGAASQVVPDPIFTVDGDGTVVAPSALWIPTSPDVQNYWLDLDAYNDRYVLAGDFKWLPYSHANIFEVSSIESFIHDQITDSVEDVSNYPDLSTTAPASTKHRLRFALHSPLTLGLYDDAGNYTGLSTTTGDVEQNIPGSYYSSFAGEQYIFTDTGAPLHIVMNGYATSTFAFEADEIDGNDTVVASTIFADVPTTPETIATMDVDGSVTASSTLSVDENGDGTPDLLIPSDDTVVYQPPASSTLPASSTPPTSPTSPIQPTSDPASSTPSAPDTALPLATSTPAAAAPAPQQVEGNGPPVAASEETTLQPTASAESIDASSSAPVEEATTTPVASTKPIAKGETPMQVKGNVALASPRAPKHQTIDTKKSATLLAGAAEALSVHGASSSGDTHHDRAWEFLKSVLRSLKRFARKL